MSKHFELMQQIELDQSSRSESRPAPFVPSLSRDGISNGHTRWANEEALRLVQQIFLFQTREPPRVVVFAGVDHGNGCSQICSSVAEILARNARRPVCTIPCASQPPEACSSFVAGSPNSSSPPTPSDAHSSASFSASSTERLKQPGIDEIGFRIASPGTRNSG